MLRFRTAQWKAEEARCQELAARLGQLRVQRANWRTERSATLTGVQTGEWHAYSVAAFVEVSYGQVCRLDYAEAEAKLALAKQHEKRQDAERQVRLLERLREKAFAAWRTEVAAQEEQLASELYLAQWRPGDR